MTLPETLPETIAAICTTTSNVVNTLLEQGTKRGKYFSISIVDGMGVPRWVSQVVKNIDDLLWPVWVNAPLSKTIGWKVLLTPYLYQFRKTIVGSQVAVNFVKTVASGRTLISVPRAPLQRALNKVQRVRWVKTTPSRTGSRPLRPNPEIETSSLVRFRVDTGEMIENHPVEFETYRRTWSGVRTPGYGSLKKSELPINPHGVDIKEVSDGSYYTTTSYYGTPYWWWVTEGGPYTTRVGSSAYGSTPRSPIHSESASNRAVKRLINGTNSGIDNLSQDLLQIGPTARTVTTSAVRIVKALMALKAGNIPAAYAALWSDTRRAVAGKSGVKPGAALADNWLALQYGWKPLLQDIDGSMRALADFHNRTPHLTNRSTHSATTKEETSEVLRFNTGPSSPTCGEKKEFYTSTCRYMLEWEIDSRLKRFLQQTGFTSPINLMWEVLPYSFVVDWLVPIGPYLEACSAFEGLTLVRGCKTQFTKVETQYCHSYSGYLPPGDDVRYTYESYGSLGITQVSLSRAQVVSWPRVSAPRFKNPVSVVHALNALALVRSVFDKRS